MISQFFAVLNERRETARKSVMLTGGRGAASLYQAWSAYENFSATAQDTHFYFGDERCVPPSHPDSNYLLALEILFAAGIPLNSHLHRMEADARNLDVAAARYATCLPAQIDVLLLSVGEDGHIASLFPHSAALKETERLVVPVVGPKPPHQRLTITPPVIASARHVFVLALGEAKRSVYEEALRDPADIDSIPARLVLDKTWIFSLD